VISINFISKLTGNGRKLRDKDKQSNKYKQENPRDRNRTEDEPDEPTRSLSMAQGNMQSTDYQRAGETTNSDESRDANLLQMTLTEDDPVDD